MPSPAREAVGLGERYRLALSQVSRRGSAGELLGKGPGASLEFQDRRAYVAGDDVRHLDWAAYARTDQLMVRLYREEIAPHVDLLIDGSRSMSVEPEKAQRAVDVTAVLAGAAAASGYGVRLVLVGDRPERIERERFDADGVEFAGERPLQAALEGCAGLLRPDSLRVLVSDFLSPHDPAHLVRGLAARAGGLGLVQVYGRFDAEPEAGEALRLTDAESGATVDLVLDARTVAAYKQRIERLAAGLEEESRRGGGVFVQLTLTDGLADTCRGALTRGGLIEPG